MGGKFKIRQSQIVGINQFRNAQRKLKNARANLFISAKQKCIMKVKKQTEISKASTCTQVLIEETKFSLTSSKRTIQTNIPFVNVIVNQLVWSFTTRVRKNSFTLNETWKIFWQLSKSQHPKKNASSNSRNQNYRVFQFRLQPEYT